ncbi:MAG TPA: hypothetical protein VFB00_09640 [Terriglobales bacterium]|nr:hypothetical protein [Terriglobales bacterium]
MLRRGYNKSAPDISDAVRRLITSAKLVVNRPAVEAGLSVLEIGGDLPAA